MSAEVVVSGNDASGFTQEIVSDTHRFYADEPESVGGQDLGPAPYELLLAALGACTSMTIGMYARGKAWPLERTVVRLRHSRVYAADCAECENGEPKLDRIERDIQFTGALTQEQRARLMEIADKCPVHRTLTSTIDIQTREI
jgi:uncharacterized OsmC-like protein